MRSRAERVYRMALTTLPRDVREAVGPDMEGTFRRLLGRERARGRLHVTALVAREVLDVLRFALAERWVSRPRVAPCVGRALRRSTRHPGYALAVVATLALGVGASTAMFSVVRTVVVEAVPFPEADRLVHVWRHTSEPENTVPGASNRAFLAWRELDDVFDGLEGFSRDTRVLTGAGAPEQIRVAVVTPGLLDLLGFSPVLGRGFEDPQGRPGDQAWVILAHELWVRRFGADPGVLGGTVELDGEGATVLGVMPPGLRFPDRDTEAWLPVAPVPSALVPESGPPAVPSLDVLGRLAPGPGMEEVNRALRGRGGELAAAGAPPGEVPQVFDLGFFTTPEGTRDTLVLLFGAVVFVLLIAAANVVSLGVSQAVARRSELSVRRALGGGRTSILGELLAENLVLAGAGAVAGLLVAHGILSALVPSIPDQIGIRTWGRPLAVGPDALAFAGLAALMTAPVVTALTWLPASRGATPGGRRTSTDPRRSVGVQQLLIGVQMALAFLLLSGCGLMGSSVVRLMAVDPGMDTERLLAVSLRLPTALMLGAGAEVADREERAALFDARFRELEEALRGVPGVEAVASTTSPLPLTRARFRPELETPGRPPLPPTDFLPISEVTEDFFATAGIPVLEGRTFSPSDDPGSVVIVNEAIAERLWPGVPAVGRSFRVGGNDPWRTVVGVVAPVAQMSLRDQWGEGTEIYLPLDRGRYGVYRTFLLRARRPDPAALGPAVRAAVRGVDPVQPIERLLPLSDAYADTVGRERFFLTLLGLFALLATALAACGVYGVVAASLSRRVRELGVRAALGARPARIALRVGRVGLGPAVVGIVVGTAAAWPLSRVLESLLFGVEPGDPATFAATAALLTVVGAAACLPAARRALGSDPVEALKGE